MSEGRVPAGVPTGGQFAASARVEADVSLDGAGQEYAVPPGETRQTIGPYERLSLGTSNRAAQELARMYDDGYLVADLPYQRGSCWSLEQRIRLIESYLRGVPVPAIMINDRSNHRWIENHPEDRNSKVTYAVVDGKQRVETTAAWFRSDFAVPASWFRPDEVETTEPTPDGPYVRYSGLSAKGQRFMAIGGAMLPMTEAKVGTLEEEADLYLLVNGGGTDQTDADMANAAAYATRES